MSELDKELSNEKTYLIHAVAHRQLLRDYPNWIDRRLLSDPEVFHIAAARGRESPDLYPLQRGRSPCRLNLMDAARLTWDKSSVADGWMQSVNVVLLGLISLFKGDMFALTKSQSKNVFFLKSMGQKVQVHFRVHWIIEHFMKSCFIIHLRFYSMKLFWTVLSLYVD